MKSDEVCLALLQDYVGQAGDYSSAGNRYLRLWLVLPGTDGADGTEVSGGSYAAEEVSGNFPTLTLGDREVANDTDIVFTTPSADWGEVVGYTLGDAATGTSGFKVVVPLSEPTNMVSGSAPTFFAGAVAMNEDS